MFRVYVHFMMNISSNEAVDRLLYDNGKYWWTGSLDELKQFVDENLEIKGKWTSPGGNVKLFNATDIVIKWNGPRSQKLTIEADNNDHYLEEKFEKLSVGRRDEQVSEGKLYTKKDDTLKSSESCSCACKCSGGITIASLEGLKLDIAILESRLNLANSCDQVASELNSIRSKQRDVEAVIRKQDEMICKLYEDNIFLKSKLESFINLIPAGIHNDQENNIPGNNDLVKNVCLSPTFINNCASGDSVILLNEPLSRDGETNAINPVSSTNNVDELPTTVDIENHEITNCDSVGVTDNLEKSREEEDERLHDEEINKRTTNTHVAVTKNYHECKSHDSGKVNNSTNKPQKVSEDVGWPRKYQMRQPNTSNKTPNELPRRSRKSDIPCPYLLKRGWCSKSNNCDYSHQNISRQTNVTPKSRVPCPFLKRRGYCLKETRCDFLHPIKRRLSTQPTIMFPHSPTYQRVPLCQPEMRRDPRSPFLYHPPGL